MTGGLQRACPPRARRRAGLGTKLATEQSGLGERGSTVSNTPGLPGDIHYGRLDGATWSVQTLGATQVGQSGLGIEVGAGAHLHIAFRYTSEYGVAFTSDHIRHVTTRAFCLDE